ATEKILTEMGIATVGDLHSFTVDQLVARFGKWGTRLWELARGIDESPVVASQKRKSWSSENTFAKDITLDEVTAYIREEAQKLWQALSSKQLVGRTVTVKLRTGDFKTATRRLTPESIPSSGDDLARIGAELLTRFDFPPQSRYRLAGIGVSNFIDEDDEEEPAKDQPELFAEPAS
ncbi:MAG: DNA polymerase IV, partial [Acidobacteria bacterium]|nr:DNA polymerase IV [Acidobacteriota bacterium]